MFDRDMLYEMNIFTKMDKSQFQLKLTSIKKVPFDMYDKFTFIVNGKTFHSTRIVSDILSRKICKLHKNDPTIDEFYIKTQNNGDFLHILQLVNFERYTINDTEIPFLLEIFESLEIDPNDFDIEFSNNKQTQTNEITIDNVIELIKKHSKYEYFFTSNLQEEIKFASANFYKLIENKESQIYQLDIDIIEQILSNPELHLNDENQLMKFVNHLYSKSDKYSELYEYVYFSNVGEKEMEIFIKQFDSELMTKNLWKTISSRLIRKLENEENQIQKDDEKRYKNISKGKKTFSVKLNKDFDGIINFLSKQSNGQIENYINVTASSNIKDCPPINSILYDDKKEFKTKDIKNSWICFDFKDRRIIPSDYEIKSYSCSEFYDHPKSWIIECSNNKNDWITVDEQKDCNYLNGKNIVHTFAMNKANNNEYRYIRMRLTGNNWRNCNDLKLDSFEIYGKLIVKM